MKKIMFNDKYGLTQAVLEGRKTQTRRIVSLHILDMVPSYQEEYYNAALESISVEDAIYNITHGEKMAKAPYYEGEEIAVAQSYKEAMVDPFFLLSPLGDGVNAMDSNGWDNKMFVRADLMSHRIKITNVRVERLQDISDEDCLKEGVKASNAVKGYWYVMCSTKSNNKIRRETARMAYADLIDATCGRGTWHSNPYVFVYDFELIK